METTATCLICSGAPLSIDRHGSAYPSACGYDKTMGRDELLAAAIQALDGAPIQADGMGHLRNWPTDPFVAYRTAEHMVGIVARETHDWNDKQAAAYKALRPFLSGLFAIEEHRCQQACAMWHDWQRWAAAHDYAAYQEDAAWSCGRRGPAAKLERPPFRVAV